MPDEVDAVVRQAQDCDGLSALICTMCGTVNIVSRDDDVTCAYCDSPLQDYKVPGGFGNEEVMPRL